MKTEFNYTETKSQKKSFSQRFKITNYECEREKVKSLAIHVLYSIRKEMHADMQELKKNP